MIPGPQGEVPGGVHRAPQPGGNTVMPSSFADVMSVGAASYAAELAALDAAGLPTTLLHTGGAPPCRRGVRPGGICSSPMRRTAWCGAGTRSRDGRWVPTVTTRRRSPSPFCTTNDSTIPARCSHSCGTPCVPCANRGHRIEAGDEHRGHRRRGRGPGRCRGTDRGRGPARGSPHRRRGPGVEGGHLRLRCGNIDRGLIQSTSSSSSLRKTRDPSSRAIAHRRGRAQSRPNAPAPATTSL